MGWLTRWHGQQLLNLANQWKQAFIEINYWAQRIVRLGIQIEHIFHMVDKLSAEVEQNPLLFQPRLNIVFLVATSWFHQRSPRRPLSQPAYSVSSRSVHLAPGRWLTTSQRNQVGFLFAIQFAGSAIAFLLVEGILQITLHKPLAAELDS